jgi:hypothetical protein
MVFRLPCLGVEGLTFVGMHHAQLKRPPGDDTGPSGKEVEPHNVFKEGTLAAGLCAEDGDSRKRDFLIEAVVSHLVDDVDQFTNILEEVGLQEGVFA